MRAKWYGRYRLSRGIDDNGNIRWVAELNAGGGDCRSKGGELAIFTDVDMSVYTTDPRVVSAANRLRTVSFEEMLGNGQPRQQSAASPLGGICQTIHKVPIRVLSTTGTSTWQPSGHAHHF